MSSDGLVAGYADGGVEGVGDEAGGGDDGDLARGGERAAGAGVKDVRVALAVDDRELFGVASGGDGGVLYGEDLAGGLDAPAGFTRRRSAADDVAAYSDEGAGETEGLERFVRDVALAESADVEANGGVVDPD